MGTKMVPSYANIFIGKLEKQLLEASFKKQLSWIRVMDDVDVKWNKSDDDLDMLVIFITDVTTYIKVSNLLPYI